MTEEHRINIMDPEIPVQAKSEKSAAEKAQKVEYASVAERFIALLIDYGVIFIPAQLLIHLLMKLVGDEFDFWYVVGTLGAVNVLFVLYETFFSCGDRATLGKSLVGVAVVKKDLSGSISFFRAFVRAIGYYISALLLFAGFFVSFFDDKHRALHDFFAGSVVVEIRRKSAWERWTLRGMGTLLLLAFAWLYYSQLFGGGNLTKQYHIRQARTHLYKIALLEEGHYMRYGYYTNDLLRLSLLSGDPVQFQRDTQAALEPKGFKIGVQGKRYKIVALAKDEDHTPVVYEGDMEIEAGK